MMDKKTGSPKRILVIDDEESILRLYQEELKDRGYEVILASNGREGVEKFERYHPDLITLDVRMVGIDGLETLKLIRERSKTVPVILCTAYEEYKQDLRTWASDAYIVKSSDAQVLLTKIEEVLG
jgi:two-component system, response regulator, stage 0 sporulation protein F